MARKNFKNVELKQEDIHFDSMIFYKSWVEVLKALPVEQRDEAIIAICNYSFDGIIPESFSSPMIKMFFDMAKPLAEANIKSKISSKHALEERWSKNKNNNSKTSRNARPKEKESKDNNSKEKKEDPEEYDQDKEETAKVDQNDAPKEETKETVTPKKTKQEETTSPDEEEPWQVPLDKDGYVLWNQVPDEHMQEAKEYCERHKNEGLENEQKHL